MCTPWSFGPPLLCTIIALSFEKKKTREKNQSSKNDNSSRCYLLLQSLFLCTQTRKRFHPWNKQYAEPTALPLCRVKLHPEVELKLILFTKWRGSRWGEQGDAALGETQRGNLILKYVAVDDINMMWTWAELVDTPRTVTLVFCIFFVAPS